MNEGEADQGSVCHPGDSACRWCQLSLVRGKCMEHIFSLT